MSGITGIICSHKSESIEMKLSNVLIWNKAYGAVQKMLTNNDKWAMGICYEHITNSPVITNPILNKKSVYGVIDAVIYNREFLEKKYCFKKNLSDEEIIFQLTNMYGMSSLSDVNGDFAGAIFDVSSCELTLFRDHLGIRPLFYYRSNEFTVFSTDVRGVLSFEEVSGDINSEWLYKNICGYDIISDSKTEIKDVYIVPPASNVKIVYGKNNTYNITKYWRLGSRKIHFLSEKKYYNKMKELITDSVKKRLDVFPGLVGAELSGGLDSGVISILIKRLGRDAVYYSWSDDPIDTPYVEGDERYIIRDICDQENITCNYVSAWSLNELSNIGKNHEVIGLKYDSNKDIYMNYALPLYTNTFSIAQTSQFISGKGAKVIFSGHGGDEGVSHRSDPFELFYNKEYLHFIKQIWDLNEGQKNRLLNTYRQAKGKVSLKNHYLSKTYVYYQNAPQIISKELYEEYKDKKMPIDTFAFDVIKYINEGNTNLRPKVTALLGAYSGARYVFPYLDKDVIDYAVSIPRYLYQKGSIKRYIFREAFKDIMPPSLYNESTKDTPSDYAESKKPSKDWFDVISKYNKELLEALDKDYWEKYLDYDVLNKWVNASQPSDEDKQSYFNVTIKLRDCLRYQSMVKTVKSIANKYL